MRVAACNARPTDVVRHPTGPRRTRETSNLRQVVEIERIGAADRKRHAVHDDRIALGELLEHVARAAAGIDEVFRDDLEPIDRRPMLQQVAEVGGSQPDAEP